MLLEVTGTILLRQIKNYGRPRGSDRKNSCRHPTCHLEVRGEKHLYESTRHVNSKIRKVLQLERQNIMLM